MTQVSTTLLLHLCTAHGHVKVGLQQRTGRETSRRLERDQVRDHTQDVTVGQDDLSDRSEPSPTVLVRPGQIDCICRTRTSGSAAVARVPRLVLASTSRVERRGHNRTGCASRGSRTLTCLPPKPALRRQRTLQGEVTGELVFKEHVCSRKLDGRTGSVLRRIISDGKSRSGQPIRAYSRAVEVQDQTASCSTTTQCVFPARRIDCACRPRSRWSRESMRSTESVEAFAAVGDSGEG